MTRLSNSTKQLLVTCLSVLSLLVYVTNSDCKFSASGHTLDITNLGQFQSIYKQWTFLAEECKNGITCNSEDSMAVQNKDADCVSYLAKYNTDNQPTYSSKDGGTWEFNYKNGQSSEDCGGNRKLNLYFICSKSTAAYDASSTYVEESTETKCTYNWYVYTQYACVSGGGGGGGSSSDDDGELSAGSWMLLLIFIFLFLYCVGGYVWNVRKSPEQDWKDVKSNTPHLTFWCMIPKWTWAGCCVTKEWTIAKYQQYRGGGNSEMLTAGNDDDDEEEA